MSATGDCVAMAGSVPAMACGRRAYCVFFASFAMISGAEMFTRFDRAAGAFEDPNVFGPFLTLPGIYLLYRMLTGSPIKMPLYAVPLLIIVAGIFLSFSRGAWGLFGASSVLLVGALFLQSSSGFFRLRIAMMSVVAFASKMTLNAFS